MARKRRAEETEGIAEWMLTYSDLVTLLLTFFIMLFAMSTVDKQKYIQVANSLRSTLLHWGNDQFYDNSGQEIFSITTDDNSIDKSDVNKENDPAGKTAEEINAEIEAYFMEAARERKLENVKQKLEAAIDRQNLNDYISLVEEKHLLILRFDSVLLFDTGSAEIKASARDILEKLGTVLEELDQDIIVQGHADDRPISTRLFPTNWELSTKRATNVVLFLVDSCGIEPEKLTAQGNGEFRPIMPNDSEENRAKNRRIDLVIDKTEQ